MCKWFSDSCWFRRYKNFVLIPWEFDFEIFGRISKLRRLHQNAWAVSSINLPNCSLHYCEHFKSITYYGLLNFDRTYAILTHVKSYNFVPGSRRQDLAPMECISKCSKFIKESYVKFPKLPDAAHLRFRPRKSFKMHFWYRGPMESWIF